MFRLYSKGCQYAIRALTLMAPDKIGQRFQIAGICEKAGIPEAFTRKVFQSLVQGEFLDASRGPGGGYALTREACDVSLLELIRAVDGEDTFTECVMGLSECDPENPCPLHHVWSVAKGDMLSQLESRSLQDLIDIVQRREGDVRKVEGNSAQGVA